MFKHVFHFFLGLSLGFASFFGMGNTNAFITSPKMPLMAGLVLYFSPRLSLLVII
jgi:hypothetical protein